MPQRTSQAEVIAEAWLSGPEAPPGGRTSFLDLIVQRKTYGPADAVGGHGCTRGGYTPGIPHHGP